MMTKCDGNITCPAKPLAVFHHDQRSYYRTLHCVTERKVKMDNESDHIPDTLPCRV